MKYLLTVCMLGGSLLAQKTVTVEVGCGQWRRADPLTQEYLEEIERLALEARKAKSNCEKQWLTEIRWMAEGLPDAIWHDEKDWEARLDAALWLRENGDKQDQKLIKAMKNRLLLISQNRALEAFAILSYPIAKKR